jgi:hypothetical protein
MNIATEDTLCLHIRVSDDDTFRDVAGSPVTLPATGTFGPLEEFMSVALLVRMEAGPLIQRNLFLRGLPRGQLQGRVFTPDSVFRSRLNAYNNALLTGAWGINAKDRTQVKARIKSIAADGTVVMRDSITGLTITSVIQLLGVPRSVIGTRQFQLDDFTDDKHFKLSLGGELLTPITGRGYFRRRVYTIAPLTIVDEPRITERRTGRPFGVLRGRAALVR